jgi:hypothetical protein
MRINAVTKLVGETWVPIDTTLCCPVAELAVHDGNLIAGGLSLPGDVPESYFAGRWTGTEWKKLGTTITGDVFSMRIYNGELIAGGYFSQLNNGKRSFMARWDGKNWKLLDRY